MTTPPWRSRPRCATSSRRTRSRSRRSRTTPPRASSSIADGTRCCSTGLSVITWPEKYGGRDATLLQWVVYEEEYFRRRSGTGQRQRHVDAGADAVRARHRGAAGPGPAENGQRRGDLGAGLVEPESGSDLASLRSTATKTDGGWLLNGQKIWSSRRRSASGHSDCSGRIRRRTPSGLTYFMFDLKADGVTGPADRAARRRHRLRRDLPRRRSCPTTTSSATCTTAGAPR